MICRSFVLRIGVGKDVFYFNGTLVLLPQDCVAVALCSEVG